MWQEIIIILVGVAVVGIVGYKIYGLLRHEKPSSCDSCNGCPLKEQCSK
ncbi:MAG: FeoB-associated Cys-rich membrane protein [Tannerella sp.]|jgi:hypothetical protein|nr:FeoB-associated Cys-rich membrane protein [Tannerella sp.]